VNLLLWLIVGGIVGWLVSLVMRTDAQQGIVLNVVVGIVGALIAGLLIAPAFLHGTINSGDFSLPGIVISLLGSILLLALVNLVRRGAVR